jgi:8-oxo-dGTP pyrophosphatase MutT (NUDIX family)
MPMPGVIHIVAAVISDAEGRILLVRKRGSATFIQPGGKREVGEASLETLRRELREELGVEMDSATARRLGEFEADAVNEPGNRVLAEVFLVDVQGTMIAGAEIEEIRWVGVSDGAKLPIAPLSASQIFTAVVKHREAESLEGYAANSPGFDR